MEKKENYKLARLAGFAFFVPTVLIAGPLAGYFAGEYIKKVFGLSDNAVTLSVLIGLAISVLEAVRIIRVILKEQKKG